MSASRALREGMGEGVLTVLGSARAQPDDLFASELASIRNAVPKRQAEFAAGRLHARQLLRSLGYEDCPILPQQDRSPKWPSGVTGSITHDSTYCAVAVALTSRVQSLGIDIEPADQTDLELTEMVCTSKELTWLESQPEKDHGLLLKILFSAKESAYKCQYPLTATMLEFGDVELTLDLPGASFHARFLCESVAASFPEGLHGFFYHDDTTIITGTKLSAMPSIGTTPEKRSLRSPPR